MSAQNCLHVFYQAGAEPSSVPAPGASGLCVIDHLALWLQIPQKRQSCAEQGSGKKGSHCFQPSLSNSRMEPLHLAAHWAGFSSHLFAFSGKKLPSA